MNGSIKKPPEGGTKHPEGLESVVCSKKDSNRRGLQVGLGLS